MAKLDVRTTVTAPDEIKVELVRKDYLAISNIFRILFEIFLTVAASLLGAAISSDSANFIMKCFLGFVAAGALAFLLLTLNYYRKATHCRARNSRTGK